MYQSRTQADLRSVLAGRKGAGVIPAKQAFPLHTLASDHSYGIFADGLLTILFRIPEEAAWSPTLLAEGLPLGSGLQLYRHFKPGADPDTYLAVAVPVPYSYRFSLIKGVLTLFQVCFVKRETARLEAATRAAQDTIHKAISGAFVIEEALPQTGFEPLLSVLGLPDGMRPERKSPGTFNMGFLTLTGNRIALMADCQSLPTLPEVTVPLPAVEQEALLVATVRVPAQDDQGRLAEIHRSEAAFRGEVLGTMAGKGGFDGARLFEGSPSRFAVARAYFLMLDSQATRLRASAEAYFEALRASGYPAHASHLAARDQFCHLFPGNVHLLPDGLSIPFTALDSVLERFIP